MEEKDFNNISILFVSGLIKKMVQYSSSELLVSLCGASQTADTNLGTLLVEVVASVLDNEVNLWRGEE